MASANSINNANPPIATDAGIPSTNNASLYPDTSENISIIRQSTGSEPGDSLGFGALQDISSIKASDIPILRITRIDSHEGDSAWSPDWRNVAFSSGNHIWVVDSKGSNPVGTGISGRSPRWSPVDKDVMVFVSNAAGNDDIWMVSNLRDVLGGAQHNLTQVMADRHADVDSVWSPDGTAIAFASDRGGSFDIWEATLVKAVRIYMDIDPKVDPKIINVKDTGLMDGTIIGEENINVSLQVPGR